MKRKAVKDCVVYKKKKFQKKYKKATLWNDQYFMKKVPKIAGVDYSIQISQSLPGFVCVNAPLKGSSENDRIGTRIVMKGININAILYPNDINTNKFNNTIRLSLVYDTNANGSLPTGYANGSNDPGYIYNGTSPKDLTIFNNRARFQVLWTQMYDLIGTQITANQISYNLSFQKFVKMNKIVSFNNQNSGTVADIISGSLLLCFTGLNLSGAPDSTTRLLADTRVYFYDA